MAEQYSNILKTIRVLSDHIELTFKVTLDASTIESSAFLLESVDATPVQITFQPIDLMQYYNSISRVLYIFYTSIPAVGDYSLIISGLKNANGSSLEEESISLTYPYSEEEEVYEPSDPITIHDKSIKREAFIVAETIKASNPYFYIVDTDPENDSVFVEEDYRQGRISITFSERPSPQFLNSLYIKVQRKDVNKIGRWETLQIQISMDSYYPTIYIYIPAVGLEDSATPAATPFSDTDRIYHTDGYIYFEENFKYRVKLSKEIGV